MCAGGVGGMEPPLQPFASLIDKGKRLLWDPNWRQQTLSIHGCPSKGRMHRDRSMHMLSFAESAYHFGCPQREGGRPLPVPSWLLKTPSRALPGTPPTTPPASGQTPPTLAGAPQRRPDSQARQTPPPPTHTHATSRLSDSCGGSHTPELARTHTEAHTQLRTPAASCANARARSLWKVCRARAAFASMVGLLQKHTRTWCFAGAHTCLPSAHAHASPPLLLLF